MNTYIFNIVLYFIYNTYYIYILILYKYIYIYIYIYLYHIANFHKLIFTLILINYQHCSNRKKNNDN